MRRAAHCKAVVWLLVVIAFLVPCRRALSLPPAEEEPRWMTLKPASVYTGVDVEYESQSVSSERTGNHAELSRMYVAPLLGAGVNGSVYHPNLFEFMLHGEGGYIFQQYDSTSGASSSTRSEDSILQRYDATGIFLREKPYSVSIQANKDHSFRNVDFFNRITVDTTGYGTTFGYRAGPVPVTVSYRHLDEEQTDLQFHNSSKQDTLELRARNERGVNSTDLFYSFGAYDRVTADIFKDSGSYHYLSLYDQEFFGRNDRARLNSTLTYNQDDARIGPSKNVNSLEHLQVLHSKTLQSDYDSNINISSSDSGTPTNSVSAETFAQFGRAALRHQLYDSLTSSVDVHENITQTTSPSAKQTSQRYGVGLDELYVKRLGSWGRLSIGNGARFDVEQRDITGGSILTIIKEPHTLVDGTTEFLRQPRVLSVLSVTDPTGTTNYVRGIDYEVITHGLLTEIRRLITSTLLLNGMTVFVDYTIDVSGQRSGSFTTLSDNFSVRLDLFKGLVGVYSRVGIIENSAADNFVLDNLFTTQSGVETVWHWLRAGAEYETHDSTFLSYTAMSLFQSISFQPGEGQTLSFDMRQRWTTFEEERRSLSDYSFVARYFLRFSSAWSYNAEAGMRLQEGSSLDQQLLTARTELNFRLGKLSTALGYEFNKEDARGEMRDKHFFFLKARRSF